MSDERPEALLKSALEKIIYFEARSEQLSSDLSNARAESERLRADLAEASEREIDLRRKAAEHEVTATRAHREREELSRMVEALRGERTNLIGRLIEAQQLYAAGRGDEVDSSFDLAGFIAELRSEALGRVAQPAVAALAASTASAAVEAPAYVELPAPAFAMAVASRVAAPPSAVALHGQRFFNEGRLHVSDQQLVDLTRETPFKGRTEETLFGFSLRELASPDGIARGRAAERLEALGNAAAAPALATALSGEIEPFVQVKLLNALATFARPESASGVTPHLRSPSPDVRIAALKALLKLDPPQAAPFLSAAMKDPDRAVRRRASLLALGLPSSEALAMGEQSVNDVDPDVRCLGALALGATSGEPARPLLLKALKDPEPKVRQAAAQSLSRLLGEDVSFVAGLDDVQLRREVRRLSTLPLKPMKAGSLATYVPRPRSAPAPAALEAPPAAQLRPAPASAAAIASAPLPPPQVPESLCAAVMSEIRCAIRGRTLADLLASSREPAPSVELACELLIARGQVVRRGQKFFAA